MTSHCRAALEAAGLPLDPRASEHFQTFWHIPEKTSKWCQRCHELKDLDAFDVGAGQLGRHSYCKPCRADYSRKAA
jgi:hypothetical protein